MGKYKQYVGTKNRIVGSLTKTNTIIRLANGNHRCPVSYERVAYKDKNNKLFVKFNETWWKFPEETESCGSYTRD